jgi:hypothetical protein
MGALPVWLVGIIGGILGGTVMAAGMTIIAPYRGFGEFDMAAKLTAATVQGEDALDGGDSSVVLGGLMHFLIAILYGVIFAFLVFVFGLTSSTLDAYTRAGILLGAGLLYGGLIFGINDLLLLPILNRWMIKQLPFLDFAGIHLLYGGILGWCMLIFV